MNLERASADALQAPLFDQVFGKAALGETAWVFEGRVAPSEVASMGSTFHPGISR